MKYNMSAIMKRAWQMVKAEGMDLSNALHKSWIIAKAEMVGGRRWTKGGHDRMYIDAECLGLSYTTYKTGNISSATWQGEEISNSKAQNLRTAGAYIDLVAGKIVSKDSYGIIRRAIAEVTGMAC